MSFDTFISRVKRTSIPEIAYRCQRHFYALAFKFKKNKSPGAVPNITLKEVQRLNMPDLKPCEQFFEPSDLRQEINFHLNADPKDVCMDEDKHRSVFYSDLSTEFFRTDIRQIWENARLQFVASSMFDPESRPEEIKNKILGWIERNPFLFGPHYLSPMELGLRIPAFFYALKQESFEWSKYQTELLIETIYKHTWWISKNLALHSSLGNHTVCECVGMVFGGAIFRKTSNGKKWISLGYKILSQELAHQILDDGGPAEQSLNYHRFVLDLYWLTYHFIKANQLCDCSSWKARLLLGEEFLKDMQYSNGRMPSIGDSDDGYAVAPGIYPNRSKETNEYFSEKKLGSRTFKESGYTVIRQGKYLFMTMDHGDLGMPPLYNHGHADALSITLYKNEKPFLIDPGTFQYNGDVRFRRYFKGTQAHNTVCIDREDQAIQETGFVWGKPYEAGLIEIEDNPDLIQKKAFHNGYDRLNQPVTHFRSLTVHPDGYGIIIDSFTGIGNHEYELNFQLAPDVTISEQEAWIVLENKEEQIFIMNQRSCFSVIKGETDPVAGWFSSAYGVIQETCTLKSKLKGHPNDTQFVTLICLNKNRLDTAIEFKNEMMKTL